MTNLEKETYSWSILYLIGDFAVLLKNGMTIRQALLCNCLSSVLSFIGMAVGLAVGNLGRSNLWIFSGIAGMFLYISLVDLVSGALKKNHNLDSQVINCQVISKLSIFLVFCRYPKWVCYKRGIVKKVHFVSYCFS